MCLGRTSRQYYPMFKKLYPSPIQDTLGAPLDPLFRYTCHCTLQRRLNKFMRPKYGPGSSYDYHFLNRETYGEYNLREKEKTLQDRWKSHGYTKSLVEYINEYNNHTVLGLRRSSHA
jgi:hypothetical protein